MINSEQKSQIIKLIKQGYSLNRLTELTRIPKSTLYYNFKSILRKNSKIQLENLSDIERGYLFGLFFGDGNFDVRKIDYSYRIAFNFDKNRDQKIIDNFVKIIKKMTKKFHSWTSGNNFRIVIVSKLLLEYLGQYIIYKKRKKGFITINKKYCLKNQNKWSTEFLRGFIGGIIDSDGFVGNRFVMITTYSDKFSRQFIKILNKFSIKNSVHIDKDNIYRIRILSESFNKIKEIIPFVKGPVV